MSIIFITTCDRCNPNGLLDREDGRGWVEASPGNAVAEFGWAVEPGGHIDGLDDTHYCDRCLDEEEPLAGSAGAAQPLDKPDREQWARDWAHDWVVQDPAMSYSDALEEAYGQYDRRFR